MKLGIVIMAAGSSSRFGENKLLQDFLGRPLFTRALDAAGDIFHKTVVVTGYGPVAEYAEKLGFSVVENRQPELGISHTVRLGLAELADCDGAVFAAADQPLLSRDTLLRLKASFLEQPHNIHAAAAEGRRGNPCLFPRAFFPELLALQGDTGGGAVIKAHPDRLQLLEVPPEELLDCDTPESLGKCIKKAEKKCEKQEKTI